MVDVLCTLFAWSVASAAVVPCTPGIVDEELYIFVNEKEILQKKALEIYESKMHSDDRIVRLVGLRGLKNEHIYKIADHYNLVTLGRLLPGKGCPGYGC